MITARCLHARPALLLPSVVALALLASCATTPPTRTTTAPAGTTAPQESTRTSPKSETQQRLINEANALAPLASTEIGKRFLRATEALPAMSTRVAFRDDNTREFFSQAEADALPAERRNKLSRISLDEYRYYYTKYGSPLAYLRALDVAAANGLDSVAGERILDFGYGSVGHLRLLASLGAHVVGVDPDSYLDALYGSVDQGAVPPARGVYRGAPGTIHLVHEKWPSTASAAARVASFGPYRLIVSKNTLKRGYIKPERRANKNQLIDLGVDDAAFLKAIHDSLVPGGLLLIYNLAPQQNPPDKPFLPHADARSPFSPEQFSRAGFQVIAHNLNDDAFVRQMGLALGWDKNDKGEIVNDLTTNLFAQYTLVKRIR